MAGTSSHRRSGLVASLSRNTAHIAQAASSSIAMPAPTMARKVQ